MHFAIGNFSGAHIQLDTRHMCVQVRLAVSKTMLDYIVLIHECIIVKMYMSICSSLHDQSSIIMNIIAVHFKMTGVKY